MSKKEKNEKKKSWQIFQYTKDETKQAVFAVVFFILGIFLTLSVFHKSGIVGEKVYDFLDFLFGIGYFLLPLFFFILTISYLKSLKQNFHISKVIFSFFALLSSLGIIDLLLKGKAGIIGHAIGASLTTLVDFYASLIILVGVFIVFLLLLLDAKLNIELLLFWRRFFGGEKKENQLKAEVLKESEKKKVDEASEKKEEEVMAQSEKEEEEIKKPSKLKIAATDGEENDGFILNKKRASAGTMKYIPLPISLLERDSGKPGVGDIKANANIIKRTLQNFGISVEMDEIAIGPSITRYSLKPAEGVKLSRIVGLQNDLALALAAHPIRIEAPIPGKSLVGIEIPNITKTTVGLGTLLSSAEFQESDKPLLISLGKAISGKSHFANLAKMPHLLIAGATGSGKSVTIHSIITSLLYRNSPENLKMIMIDPKRVELTLYNKIPHLLTPVITEAKKAILSLKWAAKEMDRRYDILESESVRDIESYHKNILEPELKKLGGQKEGEEVKVPEMMPYILIVIDELADIMQSYPRELESAIVRLAQMSRAVGIHLLLSTQRPSVNVITGLIKANVPARIALQVSSQIDSRTILDTSGAEKLLGAGDMLYLGGEMSKPQRLQSAYIGETEVKKVVSFLKTNYESEVPGEINLTETTKNSLFEANLEEESLEDDDEMYEDARQAVMEAGKASTSYLQRKLGLGYARAARLMDTLEKRGIIGPGEGSKPREVMGATKPDPETGENVM